MSRYVVTARLKPGSAAEVSRILREGPPFDVDATSLERHYVFLSPQEVTLLFEGPHAEAEAKRLLEQPDVHDQIARLAPHVEGTTQRPIEVFAWERDEPEDGLSYEPVPGPGDSEGGPWD